MITRRTALAAAFATSVSLPLAACSSDASGADGGGSERIVIGTDDGNEPHWELLRTRLAEDGIELEVQTVNDGVQLNQGVQDGALDVNLFQHLIFLSQFNVNNGGSLVPVGATAVYPLALYSEEFASVDELPEGATVAIPNNPTNLARGLLNLQTAGLLALQDGGNSLSTPDEITESSVELLPVDSNQTVSALKDGSAQAAIVNNTQAQKGGLGDDLIIFEEDLENPELDPYINAFVTREELAEDPRLEKLVAAYHSPEVEEAVTELNQGNLKFKTEWTGPELTEVLHGLEDELRGSEG